jgi:hypothetical protein
VRDCGTGPEMVLADGGFSRVVLVRLTGDGLSRRDSALPATPLGFERALACAD